MKSQNNMMDYFLILSDFCFLFIDAFAGLTLLQKATLVAMFFNIMLSFSYVFFCLLHPPALPGSCVKPVAGAECRQLSSSLLVRPLPFSSSIPLSHCLRTRMCSVICGEHSRGSASHTCIHPLRCCSAQGALRTEEKNRKKRIRSGL